MCVTRICAPIYTQIPVQSPSEDAVCPKSSSLLDAKISFIAKNSRQRLYRAINYLVLECRRLIWSKDLTRKVYGRSRADCYFNPNRWQKKKPFHSRTPLSEFGFRLIISNHGKFRSFNCHQQLIITILVFIGSLSYGSSEEFDHLFGCSREYHRQRCEANDRRHHQTEARRANVDQKQYRAWGWKKDGRLQFDHLYHLTTITRYTRPLFHG